jgi:hypothetical protein
METNNTFFQIQTFPRYEINRQGVIREARTRQEIQPIAGKPYTYLLYNKAGERRQIGLKSIYRQVFNAEYCQDSTQDITGEEWLPIAGTNGKYFISNKGRVKSFCQYEARILKPFDNGHGYQKGRINRMKQYIHRLVCLAFLGSPEAGKDTTHHRNDNRKENSLENL